jgi:hypothetical protein
MVEKNGNGENPAQDPNQPSQETGQPEPIPLEQDPFLLAQAETDEGLSERLKGLRYFRSLVEANPDNEKAKMQYDTMSTVVFRYCEDKGIRLSPGEEYLDQ